MTRNNVPIFDHHVKHGVNPNLSWSRAFDEYSACVAANLDLWEWEHGDKYSASFKARVVVWHKLRGLVDTHVQDAISIATQKKIKKK